MINKKAKLYLAVTNIPVFVLFLEAFVWKLDLALELFIVMSVVALIINLYILFDYIL